MSRWKFRVLNPLLQSCLCQSILFFLQDWPVKTSGNLRKCLITCMVLTFVIIFFYYTQFNIHNLEEEIVVNLNCN
jgi:hypothetical protein